MAPCAFYTSLIKSTVFPLDFSIQPISFKNYQFFALSESEILLPMKEMSGDCSRGIIGGPKTPVRIDHCRSD